MNFNFAVVFFLSGVLLVTEAVPLPSEQLDIKDLSKMLKDEIIHEDRAAFLDRHRDVFKVISLADIEESDFTAFEEAGTDGEPADETPHDGAFQADMMLTDEQKAELNEILAVDEDGENQSTRRSKRKATSIASRHWPWGIIPVKFRISGTKRNNAIRAMNHWMEHTCLHFVHYSKRVGKIIGHHARLHLVGNQQGCWSYVGKAINSGCQTVSIGDGCHRVGTIIHELGHAIGFHHEQSRPDRDESITVHYGNILPNKENNFAKYTWASVASHGVPYALKSIMHYGGYAFSKNGQPTITTNDPSQQDVIGQRVALDEADIQLANNMYNCPAR